MAFRKRVKPYSTNTGSYIFSSLFSSVLLKIVLVDIGNIYFSELLSNIRTLVDKIEATDTICKIWIGPTLYVGELFKLYLVCKLKLYVKKTVSEKRFSLFCISANRGL